MDSAIGADKEKSDIRANESNIANGVDEKGKEKDMDTQVPNGAQKDESSSNTLVSPDTNGQPRKRRGIKGLFKKKGHQDEGVEEEDHKKKPKQKFTAMSQVRGTILNSWINVLLVAGKA